MASEDNEERKNRELFEYYIEHFSFPNKHSFNLLNKKKLDSKKKAITKKEECLRDSSILNSKSEESLEEAQKLFLEAIENADLTHHSKKKLELDIRDKRRSKKRVKPYKLQIPLKHRLDLHGLRREEALIELRTFIKKSYINNIYYVLIIHGIGYGSEGGKSVIKDLVEEYIHTEGLSYIQYSYSAPNHLGSKGARVVCIREKR